MKNHILYSLLCLTICINVSAQCNSSIPPRPALGWGPGGRPATECERLFYRKNYPLVLQAFDGLEQHYNTNWAATGKPVAEMGMNDMMDRDNKYNIGFTVQPGSEKQFFRDIQDLTWSFGVTENNSSYNAALLPYKDFILKQAGNFNGKDTLKCKAAMIANDLNAQFNFTVVFNGINKESDAFNDEKVKIEPLQIAGAAYALRLIKNKIITDCNGPGEGDPYKHLDELRIYIGKWAAPQIMANNGFTIKHSFNTAQGKLSIQNMLITIQCSVSRQEEVIKQISIQQLAGLIEK